LADFNINLDFISAKRITKMLYISRTIILSLLKNINMQFLKIEEKIVFINKW